jgi:hypothetical protein
MLLSLGKSKDSQGRPSVVQPFALDLPDLVFRYAEVLGDELAGLRDGHLVILRVH